MHNQTPLALGRAPPALNSNPGNISDILNNFRTPQNLKKMDPRGHVPGAGTGHKGQASKELPQIHEHLGHGGRNQTESNTANGTANDLMQGSYSYKKRNVSGNNRSAIGGQFMHV